MVDDGSTDGTAEYVAGLSESWPSLRLLRGKSRGPGAARNHGVANARAALVAFADDDDIWATGRLAFQLRAHVEHADATMSFCDYRHVRNGSIDENLPSAFSYWPHWRKFRGLAQTRVDDARPLIIAENAVGTSTVMVRRDRFVEIGGFDTTLPSASDWDLWLRLAGLGSVLVLGMEGASYAVRAGSVSSKRGDRIDAMRRILAKHPDIPAWSRRSAEARIETGLSESAEEVGNLGASIRHAVRSACLRPSTPQIRRCLGLLRSAL